MKHPKIMAEQIDGQEETYNSPRDQWSRKAKHPSRMELVVENDGGWVKGEFALYEGEEVEIRVPLGPNDTVGIVLEGRTCMVNRNELTRLDEGVMGNMMSLSPINRIMQLAGLSQQTTLEPKGEIQEQDGSAGIIEEADATNMFDSLFQANSNGEFRNNPDAAHMATIGQIMAGLESQIKELRGKVSPDIERRLDVIPGIGVSLITSAKKSLKPSTEE